MSRRGEIHGHGKQVSGCQGAGDGIGKGAVWVLGSRVSIWDDGNILKLIACVYEFPKTH